MDARPLPRPASLWRVYAPVLILIALKFCFHLATNAQYGFHRDELASLDDARNLAWGFPAYGPVTPFVQRITWEIFGANVAAFRIPAVLANCICMFLVAAMARRLGGSRPTQFLAALAMFAAPVPMAGNALMQYFVLDLLWWVCIGYSFLRLLQDEQPRWWLAIGAFVGIGLLTRYSMAFLVGGIALAVLLTPLRAALRSKWLWLGTLLALVIVTPNLIWQAQHDFVSYECLREFHQRDVRIGRTDGFLWKQFLYGVNPLSPPLALAGLWFYLFSAAGKRFRAMAWLYLGPLALFTLARGRDYYMAPAYPILLAAGAVAWAGWLAKLSRPWRITAWTLSWTSLAVGGILVALVVLPLGAVHGPIWTRFHADRSDFNDEIGWPELAQTVAHVRNALPVEERARTGVLAGNYGEAGALNLYGPALGLPRAMSGHFSYYLRGYTRPEPTTVIVVGIGRRWCERHFSSVTLAARITNSLNVRNEETVDHPDIFVCRDMKQSWPEFWKDFRYFD